MWPRPLPLTPAGRRPYVGGSQHNSELELAFGSNGFDRILGGGRYGSGRGPGFAGPPSLWRLFEDTQALHAAWLVPTALVALVLGLLAGKAGKGGARGEGQGLRSNPAALALVLWGGWLVSNYLVLTFMQAAFHPYYVLVLAPPVAAVVGTGSWLLWRRRDERLGRWGLAALVLVSGLTAWALLGRHPDWLAPLRWALLAGAVLIAAGLAAGRAPKAPWAQAAVAAAALLVSLGGSAVVAVENVVVPKIPGGMPLPGPNWADGPLAHFGERPGRDAPTPPELHAMLRSAGTRWAAAVPASFAADSFILEDKAAVMALGGFGGGDSPITLDQFAVLVADGQVRYYIAQPREAKKPPRRAGEEQETLANQVEAWVKARYAPQKVGGFDVYDLAAGQRG